MFKNHSINEISYQCNYNYYHDDMCRLLEWRLIRRTETSAGGSILEGPAFFVIILERKEMVNMKVWGLCFIGFVTLVGSRSYFAREEEKLITSGDSNLNFSCSRPQRRL